MTILLILLLLSAQQAYAQADFNVFEASIADLQEALSGGQVTSVQLVNQYIERIEAFDRGGPELNSVIRINPDAVRIARALDTERQTRGARSPASWGADTGKRQLQRSRYAHDRWVGRARELYAECARESD